MVPLTLCLVCLGLPQEMLTGGVVQFLQGRMGLQGEVALPATHANHGERM